LLVVSTFFLEQQSQLLLVGLLVVAMALSGHSTIKIPSFLGYLLAEEEEGLLTQLDSAEEPEEPVLLVLAVVVVVLVSFLAATEALEALHTVLL
jgi:hypothetical protein